MPAAAGIDFHRIRTHRGDQRLGFEELTRQLLVALPPPDCVSFEHKGAGADGGVECLAHLADGTCHGFQSKFFPQAFGASELAQVRNSFQAALATYPTLARWTLVVPKNLSASGRSGQLSQRARWEGFVGEARALAHAVGRTVEVDLWDETFLVHKLTSADPVIAGMRAYWFDELVLTPTWFADRFEAVRADLGDRYHGSDHVDVSVQTALDVLARELKGEAPFNAYVAAIEAVVAPMRKMAPFLKGGAKSVEALEALASELEQLAIEGRRIPYREAASFDPTSYIDKLDAAFEKSGIGREVIEAADRAGDEPDDVRRRRYRAGSVYFDALNTIQETRSRLPVELVRLHGLLLIGEAGAGKSHSLGHMVEQHIEQGFPAVMLLGQDFGPGDPRGQIVGRLGLSGLSFDALLGALHAAAGAARRPALLVIDALNESRDKTIWRGALAGLARDVARFDRVVLIVSCRDLFEPACIPPQLAMPRLVHRGFAGDGAAAAKAYLDRNGIDRPAMPFVDAEFTNPLFLTTCVRRLKAEGKTAFPTGLEGVTRLFDYWLEGVERGLLARGFSRITLGDGRLKRAIGRFADHLALERKEALPYGEARTLLERDVASYLTTGPDEDLVAKLIAEGVLRSMPGPDGSDDEVSFTFQRFSDHFIAEALIRTCPTPADLGRELRPGGYLNDLVAGDDGWRNEGVLEALMVQTPERFGLELPLLDDTLANDVKFPVAVYLESLRWRAPGTVTAGAVTLFEQTWHRGKGRRELLGLLFQVATNPNHALNAAYLHSWLAGLAMPDRDALLGAFLDLDEEGPIELLLDWAMSANLEASAFDRLELLAIALAWLCSSSRRVLRDRASRALTRVLQKAPRCITGLIDTFAKIDDAYVLERLFAASYAASLYLEPDDKLLGEIALATWRSVFAGDSTPRHAFVRAYARGIVELAVGRGQVHRDVDVARCRPPYRSELIEDWPTASVLRRLEDSARDIVSSVLGYYSDEHQRFSMPGDFGNYAVGSLGNDFSFSRRQDGTAVTRGDRKRSFWRAVEALPAPAPELAAKSREAHAVFKRAQSVQTRRYLEPSRSTLPSGVVDYDQAQAAADAAKEALEAVLPEGLLSQHAYTSYEGHDDAWYETFGNERARLWIASRAVELGWDREKHAKIEERASGSFGRHEHAIERIGKKYQWIAYHELIGYLADHHWRIDEEKHLSIFGDVLEIERHDIDLSYVGLETSAAPKGLPKLGLRPTDHSKPASAEAAITWAKSLEDLPHVPELVEANDAEGGRWWLVHSWLQDGDYLEKLQVDGPMRTSQNFVQLFLIATSDVEAFYEKAAQQRLNLGDLTDDEHYWDRLFAEHQDVLARSDALLNHTFLGAQIGRLAHRLNTHRGEYDFGGVDDPAMDVPRGAVLSGLGLKPRSESEPWFENAKGVLAYVDWRIFGDDQRENLINADLLSPWLEAQGLTPVWGYWGEKDGGVGSGERMSRRDGPFERVTFSGLWWRVDGAWAGSVWKAGDTRPHLDWD